MTDTHLSTTTTGHPLIRPTLLRTSLAGEYLSLAILCFSVSIGLLWLLFGMTSPLAATVMVTGCCWTAFRAVGGLAGDFRAGCASVIVATVSLLLWLTAVRNVPAWLIAGWSSPAILAVMSALLFCCDILDMRQVSDQHCRSELRRRRDALRIVAVICTLCLLWGVGLPVAIELQRRWDPESASQLERMTLLQHIGFRCGEAFVTLCFFILGANIGSFLNVVAWRMPRGQSIATGDSRCPGCGAGISRRDNIPILGWLWLGGRCRNCHSAIAGRYPKVEALTGGIFLTYFFLQLISGGATLPLRTINLYRGVLWTVMFAKWDLIGLYLFHCFMLASVVAAVLIMHDGFRLPRRLQLVTLAIAAISPQFFPTLLLIPALPAIPTGHHPMAHPLLATLQFSLAGLMAGVAGGLLFWWISQRTRMPYERILPAGDLLWMFALVGAVVGWQSTATFFSVALVLLLFCRWLTDGRHWGPAWLLAALLLHHATWRLHWSWVPTL